MLLTVLSCKVCLSCGIPSLALCENTLTPFHISFLCSHLVYMLCFLLYTMLLCISPMLYLYVQRSHRRRRFSLQVSILSGVPYCYTLTPGITQEQSWTNRNMTCAKTACHTVTETVQTERKVICYQFEFRKITCQHFKQL